jgi:hypothetical protein
MTADTSVAKHAAQLAERARSPSAWISRATSRRSWTTQRQPRRLRGIVELLEPPAHRFTAVALISGRPAAYLAEYAAASGVRYLGLYDLQEIRR